MTEILLQAVFLFFFLVGLATAALGLIMLLAPEGYRRIADRLDREEVSMRRGLKPLEYPIWIERWLYRHHRITGSLLLAAGLLFFAAVVFPFGIQQPAAALPGESIFWEALLWLLTLAHGVAAVLGLVILIRPSALKSLEAVANRWISTRQMGRPLENRYYGPDRWAMRHPRATGMVLMLGGAFLMTAFGLFLAG